MHHVLPILLCFMLLTACHAPNPPAPQTADKYKTIGNDPRRDTDLARRENDAAFQFMLKKEYPAAEAALKRALAQDITFGPAHNNLGLVYFHQQQLYLAAWEFQYAVKLMPNQPEPRNNLGLVFETGGKLDQAVESYELAVKAEPENPEFIGNCARARVRRGDAGPEVHQLLAKLISLDTRPNWIAWARETLVLVKYKLADSPAPAPVPARAANPAYRGDEYPTGVRPGSQPRTPGCRGDRD